MEWYFLLGLVYKSNRSALNYYYWIEILKTISVYANYLFCILNSYLIHSVIIIIDIIIISLLLLLLFLLSSLFTPWEFHIPALDDGFLLKSEW